MKKKKLFVDVDDVLFPLLPIWLNRYNKLWSDDLSPSDISDWDISKFVKPECGKEIYSLLAPEPLSGQSLWDDAEPIEDSRDILYYLNMMMDVFIVSSVSNNYSICQYKHDWLVKYFPFLDPKKFYFVSDKSAVSGDFFIDDYYKNLEGFNGKKLLFDRPHNQHIDAENLGMERVMGWEDVYTKVVDNYERRIHQVD